MDNEHQDLSPEYKKEHYQKIRDCHRKLNFSEEEIDEIIETIKKIMEEKN